MPPSETHNGLKGAWIGLDESGKGDYFGPLVVAAVKVSPAKIDLMKKWGVRDSKNLSDKRAREISAEIRKNLPHAIVAIGPERYNELYEKMRNLNRLLAWGHARALENLLIQDGAERAVADQFGDERFIQAALLKRGKKIRLEQRPKAEDDPAVAAASVLARAEFLQRLEALSRKSGIVLPKGASDKVKTAALNILKNQGENVLKGLVKWHFKTTRELLNSVRGG